MDWAPCDILSESQSGARRWVAGDCRRRGLARIGARHLLTRHRAAWRTVVQACGWPLDDLARNPAYLRVWRDNP
jgi:hypothetical protein